MRNFALTLGCGLWLLSGPAVAAGPQWISPPETNVLAFGSLRLETLEALDPGKGRWMIAATTSYFNVWAGSWQGKTIHREFHLEGKPLMSWELRLLEQRGPQDQIHFLDVEGWREDLTVARGFGSGTLIAHVPYISIGAPNWDAVSEDFHKVFGLENTRRIFPHGQTLLYLRTPSRMVELREPELTGSNIGNLSLSYAQNLPDLRRGHQRIVAAVQVPTGPRNTIGGKGGWDVGARWFLTGRILSGDGLVGAGFTLVDHRVAFYTFQRANTFHFAAEWIRPIGSKYAFTGLTRVDSSVIRGAMKTEPSKPDFSGYFGFMRKLPSGGSMAINIGENVPLLGLGADWSLHLQYTMAR